MTQQPAPSLQYHFVGMDESNFPVFSYEIRLGNQSVLVEEEDFAKTICSAAAIFPRILDEPFNLQRYADMLVERRSWTPEAPVTSEMLDDLQELLNALEVVTDLPESSAVNRCSFGGNFKLRNQLLDVLSAVADAVGDLGSFIDDARVRLALESAA